MGYSNQLAVNSQTKFLRAWVGLQVTGSELLAVGAVFPRAAVVAQRFTCWATIVPPCGLITFIVDELKA